LIRLKLARLEVDTTGEPDLVHLESDVVRQAVSDRNETSARTTVPAP